MLQDIISNCCKESEIQIYLEEHPYLMNFAFPLSVLSPKFKLGSEYECDFISYMFFSMRIAVTIIELKLPNVKLLTKSNIPTKDLSLAISQVNKYMNWIRDNEPYFLKQIFRTSTDISALSAKGSPVNNSYVIVKSVIIIGQRERYTEEENQYRKDMYRTSCGSIEIIPYNRLIECENEIKQNSFLMEMFHKKLEN